MKKYWLVVKNTWDETVSYRLNFVLWRFRVVLQLLTIYYLWSAILPKGQSFATYDQSQILTYILGTALVSSFVLASRTHGVGEEINQGDLSNFLLRPINYFAYHFSRDIGDKAMNIIFSIFEISLIFILLKPPIYLQTQPIFLLFFLLSTALALVMYFFVNFLLGLVGFWSPEVWAPRFIFYTVLTFFAGGMFPLDILPKSVFTVFEFLPFTYFLYFPLKIYLGQLATPTIFKGIIIALTWTIVLYLFVKFVWNRGLRLYTAQGR